MRKTGWNPWRLQAWLGHKRIDETMLYVHVAENHRREIPEHIMAAGRDESDPDRRVLAMLSARGPRRTVPMILEFSELLSHYHDVVALSPAGLRLLATLAAPIGRAVGYRPRFPIDAERP